jgi:hypothetical protein
METSREIYAQNPNNVDIYETGDAFYGAAGARLKRRSALAFAVHFAGEIEEAVEHLAEDIHHAVDFLIARQLGGPAAFFQLGDTGLQALILGTQPGEFLGRIEAFILDRLAFPHAGLGGAERHDAGLRIEPEETLLDLFQHIAAGYLSRLKTGRGQDDRHGEKEWT